MQQALEQIETGNLWDAIGAVEQVSVEAAARAESAAFRHRLNRVNDQIVEDLADLAFVNFDGPEVRIGMMFANDV